MAISRHALATVISIMTAVNFLLLWEYVFKKGSIRAVVIIADSECVNWIQAVFARVQCSTLEAYWKTKFSLVKASRLKKNMAKQSRRLRVKNSELMSRTYTQIRVASVLTVDLLDERR